MKISRLYQQKGMVLALALLFMLFVVVVVVTSIDRTGTEDRMATSAMHRPSMESALDAALSRVRSRLAESDCRKTTLQASFECVRDTFASEASLLAFLNLDGKGSVAQKHTYMTSPQVYYWLDSSVIEDPAKPCTGASSNLGDFCRIRLVAGSQVGADLSNPVARLLAATQFVIQVPQFPPDSPVNDLLDMLEDQVVFLNSVPTTTQPQKSNTIGGKKVADLIASDFQQADLSAGSTVDQVLNMDPASLGLPVITLNSNTNPTFPMSSLTGAAVMVVEGTGTVTFTQSTTYPVILLMKEAGSLTINTTGSNSIRGVFVAPYSNVTSMPGTPQTGLSIIAANLHFGSSTDLDGFDGEYGFENTVNTVYSSEAPDFDFAF
ncbi:hypothetical protein [Marinospirillum alkaliphilum]|uniref:PilX N-terminal n=1 Tax=Marinospirillum alkaliphilum DSM 21637 TaxID=1122209 RepID=A0A1K1W734_9GAMM|nr:hypothetical protein [Marinospirillum alkaliphilum]SFX32645.1 hypothetical protein SAMN02745752_01297 [Marinospirillum alkaliphilum DSM 21637]